MKALFRSLFTLLLCIPLYAPAQVDLVLQQLAGGFTRPTDIVSAGDERLFIVEQAGIIRIMDTTGNVRPGVFLDIVDRVGDNGNERGLLGLVFHPDYADNGYFYVNYTDNNGDTRIVRFSVDPSNPDQALPDSEKLILSVDQPYSNHNAGDLAFGPDGFFYIPLGDGGSGGDPQNNAQTRTTLLGKLLRIDVNRGDPYSIPPDNPFADEDDGTLDEIWALGLRNPWRISFDRLTNDLWIGDVGQNEYEEINRQDGQSTGGENYGWRCYEANDLFKPNECSDTLELTFPVHAYTHSTANGCSVTGGYVYRGPTYPNLVGRYIYADYCSGQIWSLRPTPEGDGYINEVLLAGNNGNFTTFGEDAKGNLYVADREDGIIYKVTDASLVTGADEPYRGFSVDVFPNPFAEEVFLAVRGASAAPLRWQVFSLYGRLVDSGTIPADGSPMRLLGQKQLAAGVYFVVVQLPEGRLVRRVVGR